MGTGSRDSNTSSHGTPSSSSITVTTSSWVSGGTLSWSFASSSTNAEGIRSGRVDRICPSLAKVGPSSSSALRNRLARSRMACSLGRPFDRATNSSFHASFATTDPIDAARPRSFPSTSTSGGEPSRSIAGGGSCPFPLTSAVLTMTTVHRALWETRFGTFPRRNSLRPVMPRLPTTRTSTCSSCAAVTMARAGSVSTATCARPLAPAISRAICWSSSWA